MMFGGSVKRGQILGEYPEDLTPDGEQMLGRGRLIPTTPWDAVFKGIANWAGVPSNQLSNVCPNIINFSSFSFEDKDKLHLGQGTSCSSNAECDDNNAFTDDICVHDKKETIQYQDAETESARVGMEKHATLVPKIAQLPFIVISLVKMLILMVFLLLQMSETCE